MTQVAHKAYFLRDTNTVCICWGGWDCMCMVMNWDCIIQLYIPWIILNIDYVYNIILCRYVHLSNTESTN